MEDQNSNDQAQQPATPPTPQPQAPAPAPTQPAPMPPSPMPPANPGGQPQVPGAQPVGYYQPVAPQSNGKAVGALVCGILAILFAALPIVGIVLGIVAIVLAGKAVRESGKDGKSTGGKVCGIVGIVLSVLAIILYAIIWLGAMAFVMASDELIDGTSSMPSMSEVLGSSAQGDEQMEAAATVRLDLLKAQDAATVQKVADKADEQLADATGYSLTDLGVDPALFVEWMLADFDYTIDSVVDNGDGTGTAFANVELRDSLAFAQTFMDDAQAAIDSGEMAALDEAGAKAKLGELYQAAMDKTTSMTTSFVDLDLVKVGDAWQVDEESWESLLDYLFGL